MELNINTQYEIGDRVKINKDLVGTISKIHVTVVKPSTNRVVILYI